jgi:non-specific protein-tyrosine kinase
VANLGVALALAGNDVICVEADLQRPRLHERLGVAPQSAGLVDVLQHRLEPEAALQEVALSPHSTNGSRPTLAESVGSGNGGFESGSVEPRLRLLPAGDLRRADALVEPVELLSSARVSELVRGLSERADYVIFDSPPLLSAGEVFPLALGLDGVLVAARHGRTSKDGARAVRATLAGLGMKKVAVVLVDSTTPSVRA